LASQSYKNAIL